VLNVAVVLTSDDVHVVVLLLLLLLLLRVWIWMWLSVDSIEDASWVGVERGRRVD